MNRNEALQQIQNVNTILNVSRFPDKAIPDVKVVLDRVWDDLAAAED